MICEHDSYENTGKEAHDLDKAQTYTYIEMKCDICSELIYEKYLYLGTYEINDVPSNLFGVKLK
jgi:hypothetical protein